MDVNKQTWIFTPLHPDGVCQVEYDKKFDKFLNPVNWKASYLSEEQCNQLLNQSKEAPKQFSSSEKGDSHDFFFSVVSEPVEPGCSFTVTRLKERTRVPLELISTEPHRIELSKDSLLELSQGTELLGLGYFDTETSYSVRNLNMAIIPTIDVSEIDYWIVYLRTRTKYIKGPRNFNSRKARRKLRCRK